MTIYLPEPTLRTLADQAHVTVGSQIVWYELRRNQTYRVNAAAVATAVFSAGELDWEVVFRDLDWNRVLTQWDMVSGMLAQGEIPFEDVLDFSYFDVLAQYAASEGCPIHANHLLWAQGLPDTFIDAGLTRDEFFHIVEYAVKTRVLRCKDIFKSWTAVTEVVAGRLYGDRRYQFLYNSDFSDELIRQVFIWAKQADPDVRLILNENNALETPSETYDPVHDNYLALAEQLVRDGIPIDGVGFQNHFWIYDPPNLARMQDTLNAVRSMGLTVMATETTVDMSDHYWVWVDRPRKVASVDDPLAMQADIFERSLRAFLEAGGDYYMFGFTDAVSLFDQNNLNLPDAKGLILDEHYRPKPAYDRMVAYLASRLG